MSQDELTIPEEILVRHRTWVRRLAGRLAVDPDLADDLTQTACVTAIQTPPAHDANLRGWFERVLRNLLRQGRRADARRRQREQRAAKGGPAPSPAELAVRLETDRRLVEAVQRLAEPYRTVILLRFFEDLPPREIARLRAAPVATVQSQITRGLRRLREMLDEDHGGRRRAWTVPLLGWLDTKPRWPLLASGVFTMKAKAVWLIAVAALLGLWAVVEIGSDPAALPDPGPTPATPLAASTVEKSSPPPAEAGVARTEIAMPEAPKPTATTPATFTGLVVDPGGTALHGVAVRWRSGNYTETEEATARTDTEGAFELPVPDRRRQIVVADDGLATVLAAHVGPEVQSYDGRPIVVASTALSLSGRVTDDTGAPVENVAVTCRLPDELWARLGLTLDVSHPEPWNALTDDDGRFVLPRMGRVQGARILARRQGYLPVELPQPEVATDELTIVLRRPRPEADSIQGQVLDPAGLPLPEALVSLGRSEALTDHDGLFVLPLQRAYGRRDLHALKAGYLPAVHSLGETPDPADFVYLQMPGRTRSIAGVVLDAAGAPVAGARVWAEDATAFILEGSIGSLEGYLAGRPSRSALRRRIEGEATAAAVRSLWVGTSNALWGWVATDSLGRFELPGLLAKPYTLGAMKTGNLSRVVAGPFAPGTTDARIVFPGDAVLPRVAGVVVTPDGNPVEGAQVTPRLWPALVHYEDDRADFISGVPQTGAPQRTDDRGRFEFEDLGRQVRLEIEGDAILTRTYGDDDRDVVAMGQPVDDLRIEVSRRLRLRIELADAAKADAFEARDGNGERVLLHKFSGSFIGRLSQLAIVEGRSEVCNVQEDTREIVFFKDDREVGRVPVELSLGTVNVVRW